VEVGSRIRLRRDAPAPRRTSLLGRRSAPPAQPHLAGRKREPARAERLPQADDARLPVAAASRPRTRA